MKLQFTNGYRPRFDQISRILQYLLSQDERKKVSRQEIQNALGIPNNQVESLVSMMTGFGLVKPRVTMLTEFGKAVAQKDPYFEKAETLWIIHYIVSSNPEWVAWYRIVNTVIPLQDHIIAEVVSNQYFSDLSIHYSATTIKGKLPNEIGAVLAAYTRSELSRLNLLKQEKTGEFLRSTPAEIPALAFLYCIIYFRDQHSPGSSAMNTEQVCFAESSPGRVFNLQDFDVRTILGNLHDAGFVRIEQFANLDQVRFSETTTQQSILTQIYGG